MSDHGSESETSVDARAPWPPFRRMLVVQAAHGGGDALVAIALAGTLFFSVPIGEARDKVGLYLLLTMTPFAVLSPVIGPLLDAWRGSYRVAIVSAAAGRAVLAFAMAGRTDRLVLYPLAFVVLVLSRTHAVSRAGLVPAVLPKDRSLMWANAKLAIIALVGGGAVAGPGLLIQRWISAGATLRVAGIVFIVAGVAAVGLPQPEPGRRRRGVVKQAHRSLAPTVLAGGAAAAALRAGVGFLTFFLAFTLRARGEGGAGFALLLIAAGAGGLAGSLIAPAMRALLRGALLLLLALGALAAGALLVATGFGLGTAALLSLIAAACAAAGRLGFDSLVQQDAPEEIRGRAFARYETIFQLSWVGGAGLATAFPLGVGTGLRSLAAICFVGIILAIRGLIGGNGEHRRAREP